MSSAVVLCKVVSSLGYAKRRLRKMLPPGPRRDVIVEHLFVAMELLHEVVEPEVPEFVRHGGLLKLAQVAARHGVSSVDSETKGRRGGRRRQPSQQAHNDPVSAMESEHAEPGCPGPPCGAPQPAVLRVGPCGQAPGLHLHQHHPGDRGMPAVCHPSVQAPVRQQHFEVPRHQHSLIRLYHSGAKPAAAWSLEDRLAQWWEWRLEAAFRAWRYAPAESSSSDEG